MSPLYWWLFDPPRSEDALNASSRAIELDPRNPEAWSRHAFNLRNTGNPIEAERAWTRATELGTDNPLIQSQIASELGRQGDLEGTISTLQHAIALDPLYLANIANLGYYLLRADRYDEARVHAEKIVALQPENPMGGQLLSEIELLEGHAAKAREVLTRTRDDTAHDEYRSINLDRLEAMVEYSLGNEESADRWLRQLVNDHGETALLQVAEVCAWLGQHDAAFEWLNRALEKHPDMSIQYAWSPFLNSLESDPRWGELMTRWTGDEYVADF